jgi:pimeloyl-ACP methyl ester carboxylesterase
MPSKLVLTVALAMLVVAGSPAHAAGNPAANCNKAKAKAAGKATADLLRAYGKHEKKANFAKLGRDMSKAHSKFARSFAKAESKGGCATTDDFDAMKSKVDAFVENVALDLVESWPFCEPLNSAECLLPYPSTRFLVPANTATGFRLNLPQSGMPKVNGPGTSTGPYNELDGFSPMVHVLMHFPQGVDPELSDAARLLRPGCCGQPPGPPWIDTRTYDARSLDLDSPTILIDADTGERILHFIEVDANAEGDPERQVVFLRPGRSLTPSHRYIVAMRNLKDPSGNDVQAEAAFAALRDGQLTTIPAVESRRDYMETNVFGVLESRGIPREDLVLAFDFIVQSEHQLTHQMLAMRDQGYAYVATVEVDPGAINFTVEDIQTHDCNAPGQVVWRDVSGTYQSPLFLTGDPYEPGAPVLNVDADDTPVQNGFMSPPFSVSIPCSVLDPDQTSHPIVLGHGFLGSGASMTGAGSDMTGTPFIIASATDWNHIAGATDWIGFSSADLGWLLENIVGTDGLSRLNNFPALPDRLRQAMLNTLVLSRMMKLGLFNRDPAFRTPSGQGVFPGPSEEMFYYGVSLGGIMGLWFAALTPDVERFAVDVPTMNFLPCLTQRSTQFGAFAVFLTAIGLTDPMQTVLMLALQHEIFAGAEPAGFGLHITSAPLPGSGSPSRILMLPVWLDKQVPNLCTEISARTLGLPNLDGSIQQGLQEIPDLSGPLDSAMVTYDTGSFDIFNPLHEPFIPPLANVVPTARRPDRELLPGSRKSLRRRPSLRDRRWGFRALRPAAVEPVG